MLEELERETKKFPLKLNLQLFAEGGDEGGEDGDEGEGEGEKKFTQEEMNKQISKGKTKAKNSLLKKLGFEGENAFEDLQNYLEETRNNSSSKKKKEEETNEELERLVNENKTATTDLAKEKTKTKMLEAKLNAVKAGVKPEAVDDVVSIALTKIDDDNDFEDVLEAMKKKDLYASFFSVNSETDEDGEETEKNHNTGNTIKNKKSKAEGKTFAERLKEKENKKGNENKRKSFFEN